MSGPGSVEEMATFVVHLGFTPDEYYSLTLRERNAIAAEYERAQKAAQK